MPDERLTYQRQRAWLTDLFASNCHSSTLWTDCLEYYSSERPLSVSRRKFQATLTCFLCFLEDAFEGDMYFESVRGVSNWWHSTASIMHLPHSSSKRGVGSRPAGHRWTNGLVPYEFLTGYSTYRWTEWSANMNREYLLKHFSSIAASAEEALIVGAMRRIERETSISGARCVEFRPKVSGDLLYIRITNGAGCSSHVCSLRHVRSFSWRTRLYPISGRTAFIT